MKHDDEDFVALGIMLAFASVILVVLLSPVVSLILWLLWNGIASATFGMRATTYEHTFWFVAVFLSLLVGWSAVQVWKEARDE